MISVLQAADDSVVTIMVPHRFHRVKMPLFSMSFLLRQASSAFKIFCPLSAFGPLGRGAKES